MSRLMVTIILLSISGITGAGEISQKLQKIDSEFSFRYKQRHLEVTKQFITMRGSSRDATGESELGYHLEFVVMASKRVPLRLQQIHFMAGTERLASVDSNNISFRKAWNESKIYVSVNLESIPLLLLDDVNIVRVF